MRDPNFHHVYRYQRCGTFIQGFRIPKDVYVEAHVEKCTYELGYDRHAHAVVQVLG